MIAFHRAAICDKARYESYLMACPERGCEYSFANLFLWGRQEIAFIHDCVVFFSHYYGRTVYPFPIGSGDKQAAIETIVDLEGLTAGEKDLEEAYELICQQNRMTMDQLKDYIDAEFEQAVARSVLSSKAMQLIRENAEITYTTDET